ncbi:MAG TPA: hypothetical protein VF088_12675 [Pyrinomonadaceae bacterium]
MANTSDLLDQFLIETPYVQDRDPELSKWKKLPKRQIIDLIEGILRLYAWLREHDAELPDAHIARMKLVQLLRVLYTVKKLPCTEADLRTMLDLTVPLLDHISAEGLLDHVMEYIKENDLTPELCNSLREFQTHLTPQCSVATEQSLRQRLHTLLWMDEWEPLKPAKCWSEAIRHDFRAMQGERKANWRRLLKHIRGNAPKLMPPAWATEASERLAAVGIDDFNQQLVVWFAPFRSGEPLPLSVAGSHVLKGLVWYVAVSGDETAKQTALWLLDVKWKQKRNTEKAMTALEVLGISKQELLKRNLIAKPSAGTSSPALGHISESLDWARNVMDAFRNPNTSPPSTEKLMEDLQNLAASNPMMKQVSDNMKFLMSTDIVVDHDEGLIVVQGQQHFYRLFFANGRIERVTDNVELEVNWEKIPDETRAMIQGRSDLAQQCHLLAGFLQHDSIFGNYFRVKLKS